MKKIKELKIDTKLLPITINEQNLEEVHQTNRETNVLAIVTATKPCFYKLWSVMREAEKKGIPYIILNPGQHYDEILGYGLKEFNFEDKIAINLNIRGDLAQKSAEIFLKSKQVHDYMSKNFPGINLVPYINGDTVVAGVLPAAWLFSSNRKSIHGEAGLRSMAPESFNEHLDVNRIEEFCEKQFFGKWNLMRNEPFPEQWDTFVGSAASQYFFAPMELNKDHLVREGYSEKDVFVTGNTVVDAINLKRKEKPEHSIFQEHPKLEKGEWLRVDIHRRENLTEQRFKSIINSIIDLVESGLNVAFIELTATQKALEFYNIREELIRLSKERNNFLFTPLWKEYGHVIEFLESDNCSAILTDSGSMQEEMNEIGKPCLTCRFSTDRPETVFIAHSNILIPPISGEVISKAVKNIYKSGVIEGMAKSKKIYGNEVGKRIIEQVGKILDNDANMFRWSHEELGLWKEKPQKLKYL